MQPLFISEGAMIRIPAPALRPYCGRSVGFSGESIVHWDLREEMKDKDIGIVRQLEETFLADIEDCGEITTDSYAERGLGERMVEQLARLFSPLM